LPERNVFTVKKSGIGLRERRTPNRFLERDNDGAFLRPVGTHTHWKKKGMSKMTKKGMSSTFTGEAFRMRRKVGVFGGMIFWGGR